MNTRRILLLAWALAASSCLPARAGEPAPEGRSYTPGNFEAIEISGSAVVRYTQGSSDQVFVEGDEEAQKAVALEVRDGVLLVRPAGGWKFWDSRRARLSITSRELRRINISGAADLTAPQAVQCGRLDVGISGAGLARFDKLKADFLRFHVSGAGDGQMVGTATELDVSVSGRGEFRGENLKSDKATVQVSGIGDVQVWTTQNLIVSVSGVGTVDYWGTPRLVRRSSGIAKVTDRGAKAAQ